MPYLYMWIATIVADFYIVAIDGTHLCTLTEVEVERHESTLLQLVTQRHDVVFQKFVLPEGEISHKIIGQHFAAWIIRISRLFGSGGY